MTDSIAELNLQKVDLSPIKAIAYDGVSLNVLVERNGGYWLESLPAPFKLSKVFCNLLSSLLSVEMIKCSVRLLLHYLRFKIVPIPA